MKSVRNWSIRWRIAGHLLLILLLVGANLGGIWWFLNEQKHDGTAINEAGEQRLLVQKMAMEAHLIGMGRKKVRDELAADAAEYNRTLTVLIEGNASMGIPPASPSVRDQLRTVRAKWQPFYAHVQTVLEEPRTSPEFNESLIYIRTHNRELLTATDTAVQQYERAFKRKVTRLRLFLLGVFAVDLLVIPLLFGFIDRHILRPIDQLTTDAQRIARGEIDQSITTIDSADEVGVLSRSLHGMKEQLVSALQEARQLEQAVEHAGHAIYITDTDGTIEYVNPAFEEITKYSEEEAIGETPRILKSGHQSDAYYEELWETILSGDVWEEEFVDKRASGELFHANQTIAPITDEDGDIHGFVAILADNTEQIVTEQQTQVLSRVVRHNLRTELNLIDGYAQELVTADDHDVRTDYVTNIRNEVETLTALSEKADRVMREFEQSLYRQSQSVCKVIERVTASMTDQYPHADITTDLPAYEIDVLANIAIVLEELVENAIEHNDQTTPDVTITVALQETEEPPPIVRIEIEDNGPGIPGVEREVLEEGEETSLFHGSGIGLWVVYWTVTLAGGEVTIQERSPRGTRAVITLPRASVTPFPRDSAVDDTGATPPAGDSDHTKTQYDD